MKMKRKLYKPHRYTSESQSTREKCGNTLENHVWVKLEEENFVNCLIQIKKKKVLLNKSIYLFTTYYSSTIPWYIL